MTKGLALAVVLAASSCGMLDDWRYHGTQIALQRCIEDVTTKFVGDAQATRFCVRQQEVELERTKLDGVGGFHTLGNSVYFEGNVTNEGSDVIVTSFSVAVRAKGARSAGTKSFRDLALHASERFQFGLYGGEMGPTPPTSAEEPVDWTITSVKGIRLIQP